MTRKDFLKMMRLRLDPGGEARFGWMWGREERAPVGATAEVRAWRCPWVLGCWQVVGWGQVTGTLEAKQRAVVSQLPCWQSLILSLFFNTYKIISLLLKPTGLYAILTEWLVSIDANKINMVWTMLYSFIFSCSFFWLVLSLWWPYICWDFDYSCSAVFAVHFSPCALIALRCVIHLGAFCALGGCQGKLRVVGVIDFLSIGLAPSLYILLSLDKSLEVSCLMGTCLWACACRCMSSELICLNSIHSICVKFHFKCYLYVKEKKLVSKMCLKYSRLN